MDRPHWNNGWLVWGLILLGVSARLLPHPPNVTPLTAVALFAGASLPRRWSMILPLAAVVLSDVFLGLHELIAFTWGSVALISALGWWVRRRLTVGRLTAAAWFGSSLFFVVTNFGVWLIGGHGTMYQKTFEGLWHCYTAALPFYRNAMLGDVVYTWALFALCGAVDWFVSRVGAAH